MNIVNEQKREEKLRKGIKLKPSDFRDIGEYTNFMGCTDGFLEDTEQAPKSQKYNTIYYH